MIELSDRVVNAIKYLNKVRRKKCKKCTSEDAEKCKNNFTGVIVDGVTLSYNCLSQKEINKLDKILGRIKYDKGKK